MLPGNLRGVPGGPWGSPREMPEARGIPKGLLFGDGGSVRGPFELQTGDPIPRDPGANKLKRSARDSERVVSSIYIYIYMYIYTHISLCMQTEK